MEVGSLGELKQDQFFNPMLRQNALQHSLSIKNASFFAELPDMTMIGGQWTHSLPVAFCRQQALGGLDLLALGSCKVGHNCDHTELDALLFRKRVRIVKDFRHAPLCSFVPLQLRKLALAYWRDLRLGKLR